MSKRYEVRTIDPRYTGQSIDTFTAMDRAVAWVRQQRKRHTGYTVKLFDRGTGWEIEVLQEA